MVIQTNISYKNLANRPSFSIKEKYINNPRAMFNLLASKPNKHYIHTVIDAQQQTKTNPSAGTAATTPTTKTSSLHPFFLFNAKETPKIKIKQLITKTLPPQYNTAPGPVHVSSHYNKFYHAAERAPYFKPMKVNSFSKTRINHATGESVVFPAKSAERISETDAWQLHKTHLFVQNVNTSEISQNQVPRSENQPLPGELKFVLMRHAERVDLVFGPQWIETAFDRNGNYKRNNLNMPHILPKRNSKRDFINDSPITEIGKSQAKFTGEALSDESYSFQYCYVSPSLRSIQTAHHVLEAMNLQKTCKIRIEPSLFEFLGWYEKEMPTFLHFDALINFGFNIDTSYKPIITVDRLQFDEKYTDYYSRSFNFMKYLTNLHLREGASVLIVGHAATLEVCSRQIVGQPVRSYPEFNSVIRKVPYLGCCLLNKTHDQVTFDLQPTGINPLTHSGTFNFDANVLK